MEEIRKDNPSDVRKLYYLIERSRYGMAEGLLGPALAKDPDNLELQYISAVIEAETDQVLSAEKTLKQILPRDPGYHKAKFLLARVYIEKEELAEAERLLIDLIRDFPQEPQFYAKYSQIMLETMNMDKAENLAAEALRQDPDHPGALTVSILCSLARGSDARAKDQFATLVKNFPDAAVSSHSLYMILVENKKYRGALRIAQELLRNDPGNLTYLEMVKRLRTVTHPAMLPLYPLQRWGWHASAVLWVIFIVLGRAARNYLPPEQAVVIIFGFLGYILYSWIAPPVLSRLLK